LDLLVIIGLVVFCYGVLPVAGAFVNRRGWRVFRQRFDNLRLRPFLDYAAYRRGEGGLYRFIGGFESVTDGHTLWIRNDELTIPVSLAGAYTYVLPILEESMLIDNFDPGKEKPARIHWDQVTSLTEGAKVFVGGFLLPQKDRPAFVSSRENPLLVIFYDCPDRSFTARTIRAGRDGNEYWNIITPYAFVLGSFSQILIALNFLNRPAFRLTVVVALIAVFTPLFPMIPPGFLLTVLYRRLWWQARVLRAYRDLVRLPLKYLSSGDVSRPARRRMSLLTSQARSRLPDGERYGGNYYESLPAELADAVEKGEIPLIIPEKAAGKRHSWYVFGAISENNGDGENIIPKEPRDIFATYGVVPGNPEQLARNFTFRAYVLEIISWIVLLAGISLNVFFVRMIIVLLN
jgi:hypothetical protein